MEQLRSSRSISSKFVYYEEFIIEEHHQGNTREDYRSLIHRKEIFSEDILVDERMLEVTKSNCRANSRSCSGLAIEGYDSEMFY